MTIEPLEWDSELFNINIGRLVIDEITDVNPVMFNDIVSKGRYDLIYVFKSKSVLSNDIVSLLGLDLMDIMITLEKPFISYPSSDIEYDFRTTLSSNELREAYDIAEQTSTVSRFSKEPLVGPEKTKLLYRKWVDNALKQTFSDGMFIEKHENRVIGIHLIRTDREIGYFTLTGVDRSLNGKGIGTKLWNKSYSYWSHENNVLKIVSPFSFQNTQSFNFHLKHGFSRLISIKYVYHFRR